MDTTQRGTVSACRARESAMQAARTRELYARAEAHQLARAELRRVNRDASRQRDISIKRAASA